MAWRIGQGDVPFRDFFEHHPPLLQMALAPLVRHDTLFSQIPFLQLRVAQALLLAALVAAAYFVLRRLMPPLAAIWGAGLVLIGNNYVYCYYELRPDWPALTCIVGIVLLLSRQTSDPPEDSSSGSWRFLLAGFLAGLAACLTQKAWFLIIAMLLWQALCIWQAPSPLRISRLKRSLLFCFVSALPALALIAFFAAHGAAADLINKTLWINLHWIREAYATGFIRAAAPGSAGLLCLGAIALPAALADWRNELKHATTRGLLVAIGIMGTFIYLTTPVPMEQSYLFFLGYWYCLLAADALWSMLASRSHWRLKLSCLLAGVLLLSVVQKGPALSLTVSLAWSLAFLVIAAACWWPTPAIPAPRRSAIAMIALTLICLVSTITSDVKSLLFNDHWLIQRQLYNSLDAHLARGEPVLAMWPPSLPFRPHASFYPFAYVDFIKQFAPKIEPQYLRQIDHVSVIIGYRPKYEAAFMPAFDRAVRAHFRPVPDGDLNACVYVRVDQP